MPGVVDATPISVPPMIGGGSSSRFYASENRDRDPVRAAIYYTGETVVNTFGLTLDEGREFTREDLIPRDQMFQVPANIIISRDLADDLYPDGDALGKMIETAQGNKAKVIGILKHMFTTYGNRPLETRILIYPAWVGNAEYLFYLIRSEPDAMDATLANTEEVLLANQSDRILEVRSLEEVKGMGYTVQRLLKNVLTVVIVVLIFVTGLGILGMNYFSVSRRTRQIGVRRALGASKEQIVRFFLVENALIVLMGTAPGLLGAFLLNKYLYLQNMPGGTALEPWLAFAGLILLWLIAALATLAPAFKAAGIQPAEATRVG